ncbi:hypothetical protein LCGC14_3082160, partial [marine sediment metagenome]
MANGLLSTIPQEETDQERLERIFRERAARQAPSVEATSSLPSLEPRSQIPRVIAQGAKGAFKGAFKAFIKDPFLEIREFVKQNFISLINGEQGPLELVKVIRGARPVKELLNP